MAKSHAGQLVWLLGAVGNPLMNASKPDRLADELAARLEPFSDAELDAALTPHPHVWSDDARGLFPCGEVSVMAAPGREGKTFATVSLGVALATGKAIGGLQPMQNASTIIVSAEDDRVQYARKIKAAMLEMGETERDMVKQRVLVPDLNADAVAELTTLVRATGHAPHIAANVVRAYTTAIHSLMTQAAARPALLVFETASTLNDADEGNQALKMLVRALRTIARSTNTAVLLVHHTSQNGTANFRELAFAAADVRGGTALTYNARQVLALTSLGSADEPLGAKDKRARLRDILAPGVKERVSVLLPLDSSKSENPPPILFKWAKTLAGPCLHPMEPPEEYKSKSWAYLHAQLRGESSGRGRGGRARTRAIDLQRVVEAVERLEALGKSPTTRAVSKACNHGDGWAATLLAVAVKDGKLRVQQEQVSRTKGLYPVYRLARDSSESTQSPRG